MARLNLPQSGIRARRRKRRFVFLGTLVGVFVLFTIFLALLSYAPFLEIRTIEISGTETTSPEELQNLVQKELEGSYALLFAKDNIFIYPQNHLVRTILETDPIIKHVTVEARDLHSLAVIVVERKPKSLWCRDACYFMDEDGVVYDQAPEFSSPVYIKFEGRAEEGPLPKQYLSIETFHALSALVDALAETIASERVERVVVDSNNDVHVRFENGFELKFVLLDEGGDVYERFTLALEAEPFKGRTLSEFEYLDLRFGDKLYYRLKGE